MIGSVVRDFTANLLCLDEILATIDILRDFKEISPHRNLCTNLLDRYFIYLRSNLFLSKIPTFDRNVEC